VLFAQKNESKNSANFELGKGLTFNLNEGTINFIWAVLFNLASLSKKIQEAKRIMASTQKEPFLCWEEIL